MENNYDFFHLYYPLKIANSCVFFRSIKGIYIDLPAIIKMNHKNVEYENCEKIEFQKTVYLKVDKKTKINLNIPFHDDSFYFGVINISDNDKLSYLYWFNINNKNQEKKIVNYLNNNLKIKDIQRGSNIKNFSAILEVGYEK